MCVFAVTIVYVCVYSDNLFLFTVTTVLFTVTSVCGLH